MVLDRGDRNGGDAVVLIQSKVGTYLLKSILEFSASVDRYPWSFVFCYTSSKSMHKELTKNPLASISRTSTFGLFINSSALLSLSTTTLQSYRKPPPHPTYLPYPPSPRNPPLLSSPQKPVCSHSNARPSPLIPYKHQTLPPPPSPPFKQKGKTPSKPTAFPILIVNARSPAIRGPSNPAPRTARSRTRGSRRRCTG